MLYLLHKKNKKIFFNIQHCGILYGAMGYLVFEGLVEFPVKLLGPDTFFVVVVSC